MTRAHGDNTSVHLSSARRQFDVGDPCIGRIGGTHDEAIRLKRFYLPASRGGIHRAALRYLTKGDFAGIMHTPQDVVAGAGNHGADHRGLSAVGLAACGQAVEPFECLLDGCEIVVARHARMVVKLFDYINYLRVEEDT